VLITAELIGIQYCRALLRSSESKRLRAICPLFLQDEALHVPYESALLLALRVRRGHALRAAGHTAWGVLVTCGRHYALYEEATASHIIACDVRRMLIHER
jgi:hypothetical protein